MTAARDAEFLYAAKRFDAAVNRAYYAVFNAARALLLTRGISPDQSKRYATVLSLFSLHFVRNGPFERRDGNALSDAARARNLADYADESISAEVADDVIQSLRRFMAAAAREMERPHKEHPT